MWSWLLSRVRLSVEWIKTCRQKQWIRFLISTVAMVIMMVFVGHWIRWIALFPWYLVLKTMLDHERTTRRLMVHQAQVEESFRRLPGFPVPDLVIQTRKLLDDDIVWPRNRLHGRG